MSETAAATVGEKIEETIEAAEEIVRRPYIKKLARFGFYTKSFLFTVIGFLALLVAFGQRSGSLADPTGALTTIGQLRFGKFLLIIFIVGASAHAVWNILRGAADVDGAGKDWRGIIKRIIAASVGVFYLFLALTALTIILAADVSVHNGAVQKTIAGLILALPLGFVLVLIIGLSIIGAGLSEAYRGITGKFQEDFYSRKIAGGRRKIIAVLGALSFTSRAVFFVLIGWFFIAAAWDSDAREVVGLDGALLVLSRTYYGKIFLFIAAVGLISNGVLALYEARYRRIS